MLVNVAYDKSCQFEDEGLIMELEYMNPIAMHARYFFLSIYEQNDYVIYYLNSIMRCCLFGYRGLNFFHM